MATKTTKPTAADEAAVEDNEPTEATESQADDPTEPLDRDQLELPLYPTEFYQSSGISHCEECGEQFRTGLDGEPICPIASPECDRHDPDA